MRKPYHRQRRIYRGPAACRPIFRVLEIPAPSARLPTAAGEYIGNTCPMAQLAAAIVEQPVVADPPQRASGRGAANDGR